MKNYKNKTTQAAIDFINRSAKEFLKQQRIEPEKIDKKPPGFFVPGPRIMQ